MNNLSGIAYFFSRNNKNPPTWYKERSIRDVIRGLKNIQGPLAATKPITRNVVLKLINTINIKLRL